MKQHRFTKKVNPAWSAISWSSHSQLHSTHKQHKLNPTGNLNFRHGHDVIGKGDPVSKSILGKDCEIHLKPLSKSENLFRDSNLIVGKMISNPKLFIQRLTSTCHSRLTTNMSVAD